MCCPFAVAMDFSALGGSVYLSWREGRAHELRWADVQWPLTIGALGCTAFGLNRLSKRTTAPPPTPRRLKMGARGAALTTYALLGWQWYATGQLRPGLCSSCGDAPQPVIGEA